MEYMYAALLLHKLKQDINEDNVRNVIKATGVVTKTAWAGAAYNLLLYILASHVCLSFCLFYLLLPRPTLSSLLAMYILASHV